MINPTSQDITDQRIRIRKLVRDEDEKAVNGPFAHANLELLHTLAPTLADNDHLAMLWLCDRKNYSLDALHLAEVASAEFSLQNAKLAQVKAEQTRRELAPMLTQDDLVVTIERLREGHKDKEFTVKGEKDSYGLATWILSAFRDYRVP